jgi:hypothetical protein
MEIEKMKRLTLSLLLLLCTKICWGWEVFTAEHSPYSLYEINWHVSNFERALFQSYLMQITTISINLPALSENYVGSNYDGIPISTARWDVPFLPHKLCYSIFNSIDNIILKTDFNNNWWCGIKNAIAIKNLKTIKNKIQILLCYIDSGLSYTYSYSDSIKLLKDCDDLYSSTRDALEVDYTNSTSSLNINLKSEFGFVKYNWDYIRNLINKWKYSPPTKIITTSDVFSLSVGGTSVITATVKDVDGKSVTARNYRILFSILSGDGTLVGPNPIDTINGIATIKFKAVVPGNVSILAQSANLTNCIRFKAFGEGGGDNPYCYRDVMQSDYVIKKGDKLQYSIYIPATSTSKKGGVDMEFLDNYSLGKSEIKDQNGISVNSDTDLSKYANDKWYLRQFELKQLKGKQLKAMQLVHEADTGVNEFWVKDVKIINGTEVKLDLLTEQNSFCPPFEIAGPRNNEYDIYEIGTLPALSAGSVSLKVIEK